MFYNKTKIMKGAKNSSSTLNAPSGILERGTNSRKQNAVSGPGLLAWRGLLRAPFPRRVRRRLALLRGGGVRERQKEKQQKRRWEEQPNGGSYGIVCVNVYFEVYVYDEQKRELTGRVDGAVM